MVDLDRLAVLFLLVAAARAALDLGATLAAQEETNMPWDIVPNDRRCTVDKPVAVVNRQDSSLVGCHPDEASAQRQVAALNAQMPEASAMPMQPPKPPAR